MASIGQTVPPAQPVRQYAYELPRKKYIKLSKKPLPEGLTRNEKTFDLFPQIKKAIDKVIFATEHYRKDRQIKTPDNADYVQRRKLVEDAQKELDELSLNSLDKKQKTIVAHYIRKKKLRQKITPPRLVEEPAQAPLRPYLDSIY